MASNGTGTELTFGGFSGEILEIKPPSLSRESIDVTHMKTTNAREFIPVDLYDGGEVSLSIQYDKDTTVPLTKTTGQLVITPPGFTTAITCQAFLTGFDPTIPLEDKMTADITFKVTGAITGY